MRLGEHVCTELGTEKTQLHTFLNTLVSILLLLIKGHMLLFRSAIITFTAKDFVFVLCILKQ